MSEPTEESLVRLAREGDEEAFRLLVEQRLPALRARARRRLPRLVKRKVGESDMVQDACLAAARKIDTFEYRGDGSFGRWLDQVLEYRIQDVLRRFRTAKRGLGREVTRGARPETINHPAQQPSPSAHAIAGELERRVAASMKALPQDYQTILRCVRDEGVTLAEAGRRLGRSENAAAKLYARAVGRLAKLVFGEEEQQA